MTFYNIFNCTCADCGRLCQNLVQPNLKQTSNSSIICVFKGGYMAHDLYSDVQPTSHFLPAEKEIYYDGYEQAKPASLK